VEVAVERTEPERGEAYLVQVDSTRGSEIRKTRPCLVVSPDELNHHLRTVIVAPMTTGGHAYPWRVQCRFQGRDGFVAIDQLRTVDTERLVKRLGRLAPTL
jgi:mRNA interferase MazF